MTTSSPNVACVWGANGISGMAMVDALLERPRNEWKRIICISRRSTQLDVEDERIYFISIDVLEETVEKIAEELLKAGGEMITHVYHFTYIEKNNEEELDRVNKILFQKALDVTEKIAGQQIKCFSLQTGYKVETLKTNDEKELRYFSIMAFIKVANISQLVRTKKMHLDIRV